MKVTNACCSHLSLQREGARRFFAAQISQLCVSGMSRSTSSVGPSNIRWRGRAYVCAGAPAAVVGYRAVNWCQPVRVRATRGGLRIEAGVLRLGLGGSEVALPRQCAPAAEGHPFFGSLRMRSQGNPSSRPCRPSVSAGPWTDPACAEVGCGAVQTGSSGTKPWGKRLSISVHAMKNGLWDGCGQRKAPASMSEPLFGFSSMHAARRGKLGGIFGDRPTASR